MIIMKFGGTSLTDAADIKTVIQLVRDRLQEDPLLVVSAHAGVTNALEALAHSAVSGTYDLEALEERHGVILADLGLPLDIHAELFGELGDLCRGISLVGELSPRSLDYVLSFGERLCARSVASALTAGDIAAIAVDAFDAGLRSDSCFGRANLVADEGRLGRFIARTKELIVLTGFIAKDSQGNISTLGRNGSDTTAAFAGHAIDAEEIQIWTDVDGVLTADPKIVQSACPIPRMSFDEAAELANHGGEVLHPASLLPAIEKSIPVRVLNTHRRESPGTLILPSFDEPDLLVRCIAHKRHVTLVNIKSTHMLAEPGFLARIFEIFEKHRISVDMVSTSEVSVSVTLDNTEGLEAATEELRRFSSVEVEKELSLICVVGHGIRNRLGVPARVFSPLRDAKVIVRMISLGALKVNVSLVVGGEDLEKAVCALHAEFFGS